jgi:hypothetical protein
MPIGSISRTPRMKTFRCAIGLIGRLRRASLSRQLAEMLLRPSEGGLFEPVRSSSAVPSRRVRPQTSAGVLPPQVLPSIQHAIDIDGYLSTTTVVAYSSKSSKCLGDLITVGVIRTRGFAVE